MKKGIPDPIKIVEAFIQSSQGALGDGDWATAERESLKAIDLAHAQRDFGRLRAGLEVLREARILKRDRALKTRKVHVVTDSIPEPGSLKPGCYLVRPPRVGADGRALRQSADEAGVPVLVVVREPTTQSGQWPVVAIGAMTVRTKVEPPKKRGSRGSTRSAGSRAAKPASGRKGGSESEPTPTPRWFVTATDALGEVALDTLPTDAPPEEWVSALLARLDVIPDHTGMYDVALEACELAAQKPRRKA